MYVSGPYRGREASLYEVCRPRPNVKVLLGIIYFSDNPLTIQFRNLLYGNNITIMAKDIKFLFYPGHSADFFLVKFRFSKKAKKIYLNVLDIIIILSNFHTLRRIAANV